MSTSHNSSHQIPEDAAKSAAGDTWPSFFDSHFHVIDARFPLVPDAGYLPPFFPLEAYRARTASFHILGGALVSASFQGFAQRYLAAALLELGPHFVGVAQLPAITTDAEILELAGLGVRALRFNLYRGGSDQLEYLEVLARRVYELVSWHVELYIDSRHLPDLLPRLLALPRVSIDHFGLSHLGLPHILKLAERGAWIKATGFGRCDFAIPEALRAIYAANPYSLVFGTDLPSTRALRPFEDGDVALVRETLGDEGGRRVLYENAFKLYKLT
ncbi:MAG TPA: amidohydrolase family protein [Ktedonobacteraceae bacterium]